jgi:sterol 3beta-glucosyltransferase
MASQDRGRERGSRKLTRKRKEKGQEARGMSLDMPDRFKDGDDAQIDVTAPKRGDAMSMNQSLFSMIARAGQHSQVDLGAMPEGDSGDSGDDANDDDDDGRGKTPYHSLDGAARISRLSTANDFQAPPLDTQQQDDKAGQSKHRRALSEHKLLRALPKLKMAGRRENRTEGQQPDQMSSSQFLPPRPAAPAASPAARREQSSSATPGVAPGDGVHVEKSRGSSRPSRHGGSAGMPSSNEPVTLAKRIQHIFEFEHVEEVISEYPCWLLQSILLQGYMYITQKHICFYAYIPKKHVSPS